MTPDINTVSAALTAAAPWKPGDTDEAACAVAEWLAGRVDDALATAAAGRPLPPAYVVEERSAEGQRITWEERPRPHADSAALAARVKVAVHAALEELGARRARVTVDVSGPARVKHARAGAGDPNITAVVVSVSQTGSDWWVIAPIEPERVGGRPPRLPTRGRRWCDAVDGMVTILSALELDAAALRVSLSRFAAIGFSGDDASALARDARGRDLGDAERALAAGLFGALARGDIEAIERAVTAWGVEPLARRARAAADVLDGGDRGR